MFATREQRRLRILWCMGSGSERSCLLELLLLSEEQAK